MFRDSPRSSIEIQAQTHLDCESGPTQVFLGERSSTETLKDEDGEEAIPTIWVAPHSGHKGHKLPAITVFSNLCFQEVLLGCNDYGYILCLATG